MVSASFMKHVLIIQKHETNAITLEN